MKPFDVWTLAALVAALALLATLRLSVPGAQRVRRLKLIAHPALLLPLILTVPMTVGLMLAGMVPIAPTAAQAIVTANYGYWAGIAALITVVTAELWLLWTPAIAARGMARNADHPGLGGLPIVNLLFGATILALLWWAWN
ncbi:hypothetical protein ACFB49_17710 [Sphingomonas sp. DBB INV C78]|uniref:hypothetical protein n=1 Tax=Sphingomonas sp. DBB INV C78 TaxID=3349434 RepID=UPI0036D42D5E